VSAEAIAWCCPAGVLPTGRNIHALDPYRMPSPAAMERGAAAANAILDAHRAANDGAWPETVAVNLWGLDAIKTKVSTAGRHCDACAGLWPRAVLCNHGCQQLQGIPCGVQTYFWLGVCVCMFILSCSSCACSSCTTSPPITITHTPPCPPCTTGRVRSHRPHARRRPACEGGHWPCGPL
jgi:hypothetical protein